MSSEESQWEAQQQPHFHECTLVRIPQHLVQPFYTKGLATRRGSQSELCSEWRGTEPQNKPTADELLWSQASFLCHSTCWG